MEFPVINMVYNLEVECCHTYMVEGIVVHNAFNAAKQKKLYGSGGLITRPTEAIIGETGKPERVLNPEQTFLFENMVATLQEAAHVGVSAMPDLGVVGGGVTNNNGSFAVDQIIVNVDQLSDDQDYEELADKVFETLLERVQHGTAVGGLFSNM